MEIRDSRIDSGKAFDWGKTSEDYAKFRDIYPELFYRKIIERGIGTAGQTVLDIGTGTGVLPRNLYRYGAKWIGTDISPEQIEQAKRLSEEAGMEIVYQTAAAEKLVFPPASFDVITACQCFWYYDHEKIAPILHRLLKDKGKLLLLYMAWLPAEDEVAAKSEELVLKYSPHWSGAGEMRHPILIPDAISDFFELGDHEEYDIMVPFTRDSWHGRMRACRGVGASLSDKELSMWECEHKRMLQENAPERFDVLHYAALTVLKKKEYTTVLH